MALVTASLTAVLISLSSSTFGIEPLRNYTVLKVTCGEYSYESLVFIKKEN